MPFINVQLSQKIDETQKNDLQSKLTDLVSSAFSKPKTYIMAEIDDGKSVFMAGKKQENAAYVAVSLLGNPSKSDCQILTKNICDVLNNDYGIQGNNIYITYHPVNLWGWNGMMF